MKLLSIIVPSLHGAVPWLPNDSRVEIIIVRGVSPVSASRNKGLTLARGEYIAWIDSDDRISEDWLSSILQGLEGKPDVLSFNARVEWVDSNRPSYVVGGWGDVTDVMAERTNGQLWNKVIKREVFSGLSFKGASHEDYRLLCELLPRARTFKYINKELYIYCRNENGLSRHFDIDLGYTAILELINFCENSPRKWKVDIEKGVVQRVADFCRNGQSFPELRCFIRGALPALLGDRRLSLRVKVKCFMAALGL